MSELDRKTVDANLESVIKLAIMAVGGQGGGVLTNWVEECARANGYAVQATSVAGVAQRTGATIYYIEMAPAGDRTPVFSLMPAAGDVDILVAAEMMEAGRAILRGFVTPDRTTLIASTHRALAVSEKTVPGDGMANSGEVLAAAKIAAQRLILFDMNRIAVDNGTVISASLLGALAASGTLPFSRDAFENAIKASGRGVENSLAAFSAAYDATGKDQSEAGSDEKAASAEPVPSGPDGLLAEHGELERRVSALPETVADMARRGLRSVVDFQDIEYGREYLGHLDKFIARDNADKQHLLSREAAKYIARAMTYDDVIRVADLKTRASRFQRVRHHMKPAPGTRLRLTEFMHPRAEEIAGMLPARLARRLSNSPNTMKMVDRLVNRGRRLRSDRLWPFLQLYCLGGLRRWRRGTLRHAVEREHLDTWLKTVDEYLAFDYDLAVEVLRCRRLIKGYSDTHARGLSKFDKALEGAAIVAGRPDAAEWVGRLIEAALQDEKSTALDGALQTIRSFATPEPAQS